MDPRLPGWILADAANPLNQIANMIPAGARVLDIGAGNGILALLLVAQGKKVDIDAVEPHPKAGELATPHYRSLFAGDLDAYLAQTDDSKESYDFIVMADVLEHIAYPEPLLLQIKEYLVRDGLLVCSTPNIGYVNIRLQLLHGIFDYVDSGILERTHLRLYTLKTLSALFEATGWHPASRIDCVRDPLFAEPSIRALPFSPFSLARAWRDPLSRVFQFVFALGRNSMPSMTHTIAGDVREGIFVRYCLNTMRTMLTPSLRGGA